MVRTSFKVHLGVLALGVAVPIAAFALEAGTRDVPAKEITVPTADVSPQEQALIGAPLPPLERSSQGFGRMEGADQRAR